MIDLHAHILYGLDDGAKTREETMAMLLMAVEEGITTMVTTPHYIHGANYYSAHEYQVRLAEVQEMAQEKGLPITLLAGNEMFMDEWTLENYKTQKALTLTDTQYALIEFPLLGIPTYADNIIDGLLENDFIPLLAHPERYPEIQEDPGKIERFIRKGCFMQANSGSITGLYGRRVQATVKELLLHDMIHVVATDCHSPRGRSPRIQQAYLQARDWIGPEEASTLFEENPQTILNNETLEIREPLSIPRKKGFIHKMKQWTDVNRSR